MKNDWLVRKNLTEKPKATMFEDIGKTASYSKFNKKVNSCQLSPLCLTWIF